MGVHNVYRLSVYLKRTKRQESKNGKGRVQNVLSFRDISKKDAQQIITRFKADNILKTELRVLN